MKSRSTVTAVMVLASLTLAPAGPARRPGRAVAQTAKPSPTTVVKFGSKKTGEYSDKNGNRQVRLEGEARLEMSGSRITGSQILIKLSAANDIQEIRATGNVRIQLSSARVAVASAQPITATCREAVYREATRQLTLEGPVAIKGEGKPDSKVLGFSANGQRAVIEMTTDGTLVKFEGESEFELLMSGDVSPLKPGRTATPPGKSN